MATNYDNFRDFFSNATNVIRGWFGMGQQTAMVRAEKQRLRDARTALEYFEGDAPKQLKVDPRSLIDDNVYVNYPQLIVEKGVSFLFGEGVQITVGEESQAEEMAKVLEGLWDEDTRTMDLHELATDGALFGLAIVKLQAKGDGSLRVVVPDPQNYMLITDPDDAREIEIYRCQYQRAENDWFREDIREENGRWVIEHFTSVDGEKWYPVDYGEDGSPTWNYDFAPIYVCQNLPKSKSAWGRPDLTRHVLDLTRYLSRVDSLIGKIVRVHASPKPVAKGLNRQDLELGVDSMLFLTSPQATIELLEMKGDLAGALAFRKTMREALAEVSKVPEIATSKLEAVGSLSGRALRILYGPLIDQTMTKRRLYGRLIRDVIGALMASVGRADVPIQLNWPPAVKPDAAEEAELTLKYQDLGVSKHTILEMLGFDPEFEAQQRESERPQAVQMYDRAFNAGEVG